MAVVLLQPSGRRAHWLRPSLAIAFVVACLAGISLSFLMLRGDNPLVSSSAAQNATAHIIGEDVRTSFGVIAVEHATAISGLNDQQVTGAHGVPGLVEAGSIDVQVAAVITNLTDDVISYQATQFELVDATGATVPMSRAPQLPGELQPFAAIDVLVDYVTTTNARPFKVRFVDPATKEAIYIDLGAVGCTVQSGTGRPLPVAGGCAEAPQAQDHTHG
jgi:hypothetical protein